MLENGCRAQKKRLRKRNDNQTINLKDNSKDLYQLVIFLFNLVLSHLNFYLSLS